MTPTQKDCSEFRTSFEWDEAQHERVANRVWMKIGNQGRGARLWIGVGASLTAAACVICVLWLLRAAPEVWPGGPVAQPPPGLPTEEVIRFADDSSATLLYPGTDLEIATATSARTSIRMHRGHARFKVVKNPKRVFAVNVGALVVEVLGTVFDVESGKGKVTVTCHDGAVAIHHLGQTNVLKPGMSMAVADVVDPPSDNTESQNDAAQAVDLSGVAERILTERPATSDVTNSSRRSRHSPAGSANRLGAGRRHSAPKGVSDRAAEKPSGEDPHQAARSASPSLYIDGKVALENGDDSSALVLLRDCADGACAEPFNHLALFDLARIALRSGKSHARAAALFEAFVKRAPTHPLAEDALARAAMSWKQVGRKDKAESSRELYLSTYPHGHWVGALSAAWQNEP